MKRTVSTIIVWVMLFAAFLAAGFAFRDLWLTRTVEGVTSTTRVWNWWVAAPLAVVVAGLFGLSAVNFEAVVTEARSRRSAAALNVGLMIVFAAGIAAIVNVIAAKHYRSYDWTLKGIYTLSERTENVLEHLPRKVTAHLIGSAYGSELYTTVRGTLDMYRAASHGNLEVETLDPAQDRDKLLRTLKSLGVNAKEIEDPDLVIFEAEASGPGLPRTKQIAFHDLEDMDYSRGEEGATRRGLKAEQLFTEAILDVTREKQTAVYFLSGHGELEPFGQSRDAHVSTLDKTLKRLSYRTESFAFDFGAKSEKRDVPADCDVLVICRPKSRIDDREIERLRAYLDRGGRLLVLAEPVLEERPGTRSVYFDDVRLDALLKPYGLSLSPAYVYDEGANVPQLGEFAIAPVVAGAGETHPITKPLVGVRVLFDVAQPVVVDAPADPKVRAQSILQTGAGALALKDLNTFARTSDPYRTEHDPGPITLVAVSTKECAAPTPTAAEATTGTAAPEPKTVEARIVAIGAASVATDDSIDACPPDLDLVLNSIGWLAARAEQISIGPKAPEVIHLRLLEDDRYRVMLLSLFIIPALCALAGLGIFWVRRT